MNLSKHLKTSYTVFAITMVATIVMIALTLGYFISLQGNDAIMINKSGRQRMLSQKITKIVFYQRLDQTPEIERYSIEDLNGSIKEWEDAQRFLWRMNKQNDRIEEIDSLLSITGKQISVVKKNVEILVNSGFAGNPEAYRKISETEEAFLTNMEQVTLALQNESERKNQMATTICYSLTAIALIIILAEFFLVILPSQRQIRAKNVHLTTANKQLSDFAQITAHNLRAPIGNLIFLSNFYKDADSDEERAELFEKFEKVIHHLDETTNVLLDGLKIKTDKGISIDLIEFQKVVDHTSELLVGEILKTGARITTDFSDAPSINYNRVYLDSIMLNLLGNALKYSSPERTPKIHISSSKHNNTIKLMVKDNGLGIDLDHQEKKIFGLHQTFHRNPKAKGIGLFMTKNQIQSLNGTIEVESLPNKGSTFIVTFKQ